MSTNNEGLACLNDEGTGLDRGAPVWAEIRDSRRDVSARVDIRRWLMVAPTERITAASDELWGIGYATDPISEFYRGLRRPGPDEDVSAISALPIGSPADFSVILDDPEGAEAWIEEHRPDVWR